VVVQSVWIRTPPRRRGRQGRHCSRTADTRAGIGSYRKIGLTWPEARPIPTPHNQAPPRFAKRPRLQFPHSQAVPHRRRCNASRSGFCANSVFGSKLARSMPLFQRRKERLRRKSKQPQRSCCGDAEQGATRANPRIRQARRLFVALRPVFV
jgi:hypothetical protein